MQLNLGSDRRGNTFVIWRLRPTHIKSSFKRDISPDSCWWGLPYLVDYPVIHSHLVAQRLLIWMTAVGIIKLKVINSGGSQEVSLSIAKMTTSFTVTWWPSLISLVTMGRPPSRQRVSIYMRLKWERMGTSKTLWIGGIVKRCTGAGC